MLKKNKIQKKNNQKQGSSFIEIEIKQYIISTVVTFILQDIFLRFCSRERS